LNQVFETLKEIVLGHWYEGEPTPAGITGQVAAGFTGADTFMDIGNLAHDFTHWEWSRRHVGKTVLDGVGLVPIIGAAVVAKKLGKLDNVDEAVDVAGEVADNTQRTLSQLVPKGKIPWGDNGSDFVKWFDDLSKEELELVLKKYDLGDLIRYPRGKHEWLKVEHLQKFKEWNVSMSEIWRFRTDTTKLVGTIPGTNRKFAHTIIDPKTGRKVSGPGSGQFDKELAKLTDDSTSINDYNRRLRKFLKRWKIDQSLVPKPYPRGIGR